MWPYTSAEADWLSRSKTRRFAAVSAINPAMDPAIDPGVDTSPEAIARHMQNAHQIRAEAMASMARAAWRWLTAPRSERGTAILGRRDLPTAS